MFSLHETHINHIIQTICASQQRQTGLFRSRLHVTPMRCYYSKTWGTWLRWEGPLADERSRIPHMLTTERVYIVVRNPMSTNPRREEREWDPAQQRLQSAPQAARDPNTAGLLVFTFMHPPPSHTHSYTYFSCFTIYRISTSLTRAS